MKIVGKKVTLRAVEQKDIEDLHAWANEPEIQRLSGNSYFPSSLDFHKDWYEKQRIDTKGVRLAIVPNDKIEIPNQPSEIVGLSTILDIDWRNGRAWHGVLIGTKQTHGKGYATDAILTTMKYCFEELRLNRLDGGVHEENKASFHVYCNKLGWKVEGKKRQYFYQNGRYWDYIVVGVLKEDYTNLLEKETKHDT